MIPAENTTTQVDDLPALEEVDFEIGDPRWVMRTQADLYSNRELAVVREYSTNAFDANKEKALATGAPVEPIEVSLPSMMDPYFKVRDFGNGMSRNVLTKVYTKFGISTKRDSNEYNGMLGYGSKSALAYSPQFTVTSIHDGMKTVAIVARKPDWSITMKVMVHEPTNEQSGTEVIVPVHNASEFTTKAMDFYKFWRTGTVLVNEETPESLAKDQFFDNFYHSPSRNSYLVMGNVPYLVGNVHELFRGTEINYFPFIAYVDTGDVEFTPSREALKYTEGTVKVLKEIVNEFADKVKARATEEVESAKSHAEAYEKWSYWKEYLGYAFFGTLTYKGDALVDKYPVKGYQYAYASRGRNYRVDSWHVSQSKRTLFVTGINIPPSAAQKSKAEQYRSLKTPEQNIILFLTEDTVPSPWVDNSAPNVVSWETVKAAVPTPRRASSGRSKDIKGSFDILLSSSSYEQEMEIPDDYVPEEWFYVTARERSQTYNIVGIKNSLPDGTKANVVVVPANRLNKFKRDYPDIKYLIDFANSKVVKDGTTLLSDESKALKRISYDDTRWLDLFSSVVFDDPELNALIKAYKGRHSVDDSAYESNRYLAGCLFRRDVKEFDSGTESDFVVKRYPLLDDMRPWSQTPATVKEIAFYMNAKYNSSISEDKNE